MSLVCSTSVQHIPAEVWQHIFAYLPAKQLLKIRQVCLLWRDTIDDLAGRNSFWRTHCKRDFSDVYNIAYYKARIGTPWFNIYRSLTLWSQLTHAKEIKKEFTVDSDCNIRGMQVVQDGVIGVLKNNEIIYYDIETMEPIRSLSLRRADDEIHTNYKENQHIIYFGDYCSRLFVIFKTVDNPNYEVNTILWNVNFSLLVNDEIFYVDQQNNILNCKLFDGKVNTTKLIQSKELIKCLGYTDQLNYFTERGNIYSFVNGNESFCSHVKNSRIMVDQLHKYNLLETVDWEEIYSCLQHLDVDHQGSLESIYTIKVYGKVVLVCVCADSPDFYIFYDPFINGEFDIFNSQPIKKYALLPGDGRSWVFLADALETVDGHTVIVSTTEKIITLDFIHSMPKLM